jgi:adenylate cyclase
MNINYDLLTRSYYRNQVLRVKDSLHKLEASSTPSQGKVIPSETDLVLGTGRTLSMAVMFLDISSFSSRPAESPADQLKLLTILNFFFTEMTRVAEDYGGTVEKNTGDGLMAYFQDGGGTPSESGAKRAVSCALTMMHAGQFLINPVLRLSGIEPIHFRIGIEYGVVTVARLGAPRRFNATVAVGATANLASKMLGAAQAGQIVVGDAAKLQLPLAWQRQWTKVLPEPTGWEYSQTGLPYPFHLYTGRWTPQ